MKPRLRSLVTFNTMNLTKPVYIGRFDCIFCMDVLPHLSRAQRTALMERLHLYLEPGGYLFLSQTEKLYAPNLNFRSETYDGYTFHRKPLAAAAAYGRCSLQPFLTHVFPSTATAHHHPPAESRRGGNLVGREYDRHRGVANDELDRLCERVSMQAAERGLH